MSWPPNSVVRRYPAKYYASPLLECIIWYISNFCRLFIFSLILNFRPDLDPNNLEGNSSEASRIFRTDELFSAFHYSGRTRQTALCCRLLWHSINKFLSNKSLEGASWSNSGCAYESLSPQHPPVTASFNGIPYWTRIPAHLKTTDTHTKKNTQHTGCYKCVLVCVLCREMWMQGASADQQQTFLHHELCIR